jgi:hypothetical protein
MAAQPVHRDGVPYRDARNREQYGRQLDGARDRAAYRGDDAQRAKARQNALSSLDRHGIERPATSNVQARERMREAQTERNNNPRLAERRQDAPRANQGTAANQRRQNEGQASQAAQRQNTGRARNAFDGVRSPSRSSAQANRGRTSQAFAQRAAAPRASGHQISAQRRRRASTGRRPSMSAHLGAPAGCRQPGWPAW